MIREAVNDQALKTLLDSLPVSIFIKDAQSRFVFMNRACEDAWQVKLSDLLGNDGGHMWPADQQAMFLAADKKVFAEKLKIEFNEWLWNEALQQNQYYLTTKTPIYDALGQPQYLIAVCEDITERQQSELQISRLSNLYKALSEVNQAIVRLSDEQTLFDLVCRVAVELGGMQMAWIGHKQPGEHQILKVAKYAKHLDYLDYLDKIEVSTSASVPEGRGPVGIVFREKTPIIINHIDTDPSVNHWRSVMNEYAWQSLAAFPILKNNQSFAVLTVYDQKNVFDESIVALLKDLSKDVSFALDNIDREKQRKAEVDAQKLAALVYEISSEAMFVLDDSKTILSINSAFSEVTGYAATEVVGQHVGLIKSSLHDAAFSQVMCQEINATGKWHGEVYFNRKKGELFPARLSLNTLFHEDGSVKYQVCLFKDISQQKQDEEVILRQSNIDALTGLASRRMFHHHLEQEIKRSQHSGLPLALMFLDLDGFKEVNDTLGHSMGDLLLKQTAERLKLCAREFDSIARLGGDEFTLILSEVDDLQGVDRVIEAILRSIAEPFQLKDKEAFISVSIGVTLYPNDAEDADALLKNADQAMYAAKNAGRNQFSYFTPSMQSIAQKRMRLAMDLRNALQDGQIKLVYQPILDLKTGGIVKAEALVRWTHPEFGAISPAEFIPIAEQTKLIVEIGQWIFQQAMKQVKKLQQIYSSDFQVSVNKSPVQIQNKMNNYAPWGDQLAQAGLSGNSIVLEITEGLLLDENEFVNKRMLGYKDAGIQLALDDFGTGYSSLSYLKKFNVDYIKIDRAFVSNLAPNSDDLALCEAMILIAHKLGMKVIAEGVETEAQKELLISLGCDFGQGYLFSKPLPAEDFESLLLKNAVF